MITVHEYIKLQYSLGSVLFCNVTQRLLFRFTTLDWWSVKIDSFSCKHLVKVYLYKKYKPRYISLVCFQIQCVVTMVNVVISNISTFYKTAIFRYKFHALNRRTIIAMARTSSVRCASEK